MWPGIVVSSLMNRMQQKQWDATSEVKLERLGLLSWAPSLALSLSYLLVLRETSYHVARLFYGKVHVGRK